MIALDSRAEILQGTITVLATASPASGMQPDRSRLHALHRPGLLENPGRSPKDIADRLGEWFTERLRRFLSSVRLFARHLESPCGW